MPDSTREQYPSPQGHLVGGSAGPTRGDAIDYTMGVDPGRDDRHAEALTITLDRKLGGTGAAYDPPGPQRAYTYQHQPHNGPAYNLGCAVAAATFERSGDTIDVGLRLLKELQTRGFGVFETEPSANAPSPSPQEGNTNGE